VRNLFGSPWQGRNIHTTPGGRSAGRGTDHRRVFFMPGKAIRQPLLIAVTGTDGAGKTTVTRSVVTELRSLSHAVGLNDRWDIVGNPVLYPTARFLIQDIPLLRTCITDMSPRSRLLFLLWTMHLSLADQATEADNTVLLTDSYWMKHAASEVVYGLDSNWTSAVCRGLPRPEIVLYLRVSPELAWQRIGMSANAYECGMDSGCSKAAFLRHQRAMQEVLDEWARAGDWLVIDADQPRPAVRQQVVGAVRETLSAAPSMRGGRSHG
jgi:dTMP kinase